MADHNNSSLESEDPVPTHLVISLEMQEGYDRSKKHCTNLSHFLESFGARPSTACTIYEDLQKTNIVAAKIKQSPLQLKYFLISLYFTRHYPLKSQMMEPFFKIQKHGWLTLHGDNLNLFQFQFLVRH
jgi:hypothetical protein